MPTVDGLCAEMRAQGRRVTPQRRAVIQVLLGNEGEHPTAEQIFTRVRSMIPDMSPATVYNTLHELVEMGALLELDLGLGERHYDINTPDHAHLVCLECGRVEDVPYDHEALTLLPEHEHGFRVVDCRVVFRGYCPACAFRRKAEKGLHNLTSSSRQEERAMDKWECMVCGYIYDPEKGDPDNGIALGTSFEALPDDWVCPDCGAGKEDFERVE